MRDNVIFTSKTILLIILLILIVLPSASPGWFDILKGDITADATHSVELTIQDIPPIITLVGNDSMSPVLLNSGYSDTPIHIWFVAEDLNGVNDLLANSINIVVQHPNEAIRTGVNCTRNFNLSLTSSNFSCILPMKYYDAGANWNINISIKDMSDNEAINDTTYFDIYSSMHILLDRIKLNWSSSDIGSNYVQANNPIYVINVGNIDINNITVTAYNLQGPLGGIIDAGNFTARNDTGCGGNILANGSSKQVYFAKASRETKGVSTQPIYYCITTVPNVIPGQYDSIQNWVTTSEG